jgi:hypothetical protein
MENNKYIVIATSKTTVTNISSHTTHYWTTTFGDEKEIVITSIWDWDERNATQTPPMQLSAQPSR